MANFRSRLVRNGLAFQLIDLHGVILWVQFLLVNGFFTSVDNRQCVNPQHLFLGTVSDNFRDALQKGRLYQVWPKGHHPYNEFQKGNPWRFSKGHSLWHNQARLERMRKNLKKALKK